MTSGTDAQIGCIPRPRSIERRQGEFVVDDRTTVTVASRQASRGARLLRESLRRATALPISFAGEDASIRFDVGESFVAPGAYRLEVSAERIMIRAGWEEGYVNAVQTLRQLLPPEAFSLGPVRRRWTAPAVVIEDAPRFSWRGVMIDVARHFVPFSSLVRLVELVAMHKLNVLHLHLNDDQGWRFPSERYPRLIEVGAWRRETRVGHELDRTGGPVFDGTPHGGFYSRDELEALVAYAEARNVVVVPEIDLPGHAQAAIASYPELGHVGPVPVRTQWGISAHVLNVSDEALDFCRAIWGEVADVFPSRIVHIGGDECPRDEWHDSPIAAKRIRDERLSGVDEIQSWFTRELAAYLDRVGRRMIGWDEILEGGNLPFGVTVMSWRGERAGVAAARAGYEVVMSPEFPCYLDHYQSDDPREPLAIGGRNRIEDLFAYEPAADEVDASIRDRILGLQANLWTEYVPDPQSIEYMAFPRLCALSERAWSSAVGDFSEFSRRLQPHLRRLDASGVNYRPPDGPRPWQQGGEGPRKRFDRRGD